MGLKYLVNVDPANGCERSPRALGRRSRKEEAVTIFPVKFNYWRSL
jgi:hypothetical protein